VPEPEIATDQKQRSHNSFSKGWVQHHPHGKTSEDTQEKVRHGLRREEGNNEATDKENKRTGSRGEESEGEQGKRENRKEEDKSKKRENKKSGISHAPKDEEHNGKELKYKKKQEEKREKQRWDRNTIPMGISNNSARESKRKNPRIFTSKFSALDLLFGPSPLSHVQERRSQRTSKTCFIVFYYIFIYAVFFFFLEFPPLSLSLFRKKLIALCM
jgi:hypothetical protein